MKMTSFACLALLLPLPFSSFGSDATPATSSQVQAPSPTWPSNGIAQREFRDGSHMFVENDGGKLRAWVLTETDGPNVEALDFFSGERLKVRAKLTRGGYQADEFIDGKGKVHKGTLPGRFNAISATLNGEIAGLRLNTAPLITVRGSNSDCYLSLNVTNGSNQPGAWRKVPLYHIAPANQGCPSGYWHSLLGAGLDLSDGTVLVAGGCWVFRLRASDLSPVGSAPSLHVIDASVIEAAIARAKDSSLVDPVAYLAETMHLPMDTTTSCKEN